MKRAGTSAFALTLPQGRTAAVISIDGRQFDGLPIELADLCTCSFDWQPDFRVQRSAGCVIDQHRVAAIHGHAS